MFPPQITHLLYIYLKSFVGQPNFYILTYFMKFFMYFLYFLGSNSCCSCHLCHRWHKWRKHLSKVENIQGDLKCYISMQNNYSRLLKENSNYIIVLIYSGTSLILCTQRDPRDLYFLSGVRII